METMQCLLQSINMYPQSEPQDWIKLLYQSEFGAGHLIADPATALTRLEAEFSALEPRNAPLVEPIGGGYCRLNLQAIERNGLRLSTVCGLFVCAANNGCGSTDGMNHKLDALIDLARAGKLPLPEAQARAYIDEYRAQGLPMVSHSARYRAAYQPAYRLVPAAFGRFAELFARIDSIMMRKPRVLIAIDGNSGAGKSSLGELLARVYSANLIHMDDFFLPAQKKTPQRLAEIGGNVDYERFLFEVGAHLAEDAAFTYRPYDCSQGALGNQVIVHPSPLTIVEGSYSQHPTLKHLYDLTVFLSLDAPAQSERIRARNGAAMHKRFLSEWIPLEERYFGGALVRERADLVFSV